MASQARRDPNDKPPPRPRYVGPVPVENLWQLQALSEELAVPTPTEPIPDLVARTLCQAVRPYLHRGLLPSFRSVHKEMAKVRGRLDVRNTLIRKLLDRGRVSCHFEELRLDTVRHCHAAAALQILHPLLTDSLLAHQCQDLVQRLSHAGILPHRASKQELLRNPVMRHDNTGQRILWASNMAFGLAGILKQSRQEPHACSPQLRGWITRYLGMAILPYWKSLVQPHGWRIIPGRQQVALKTLLDNGEQHGRKPINLALTLQRQQQSWLVFIQHLDETNRPDPLSWEAKARIHADMSQLAALATPEDWSEPPQVLLIVPKVINVNHGLPDRSHDRIHVEEVNLGGESSLLLAHLRQTALRITSTEANSPQACR